MSKVLSGENAVAFERWEAPSVDFMDEPLIAEEVPSEPEQSLVSQQELEEIHQQAHAKGYQMGRWEGMNAGREELEAQGRKLAQLMNAFSHPFEQLDEQVQQELALLAGAIAGQLVHREIHTDPAIMNNIVRSAVNALHSVSRRVDVHLNPQDAELVRDSLKSPDSEQSWHIVEDPSLQSGDVRVVSNDAFVDASLRTRLHSLMGEMLNLEPADIAPEINTEPASRFMDEEPLSEDILSAYLEPQLEESEA